VASPGSAADPVLEQIATWPAKNAAVAVVDGDDVLASYGPDLDYAWASVTKLLSALTVLDLVQDESVALDEPAGPPGSTVRHLLAHAAGLAPDDDTVLAAPGRRRVYSNRGFEVLADFVASRVRTPFADLFHTRVCEPLGLAATRLVGSPAQGARGSLADLARVGRELLAPTLIRPDLMTEATQTVFPGLTGVLPGFGRQDPNDWGLGFEIRDAKSPHWTGSRNSPRTFGHFGRTGTFLWVDPEAGLACACLTDLDFGPWAASVWPELSDDVLGAFGGEAYEQQRNRHIDRRSQG
jgi:CubicO group peptidase (beta-lactamase class C family)